VFLLKIPPAVVLFFLAPAIAELLSGSAPPAEFFHPISFLLLASLYGSGALVVRELKLRWNKGYVSMFVLGAAYGIIEEGLMVKSFFDPEWMDLGILGVYGRWQEVSWVWSEWLTIYHAIFSIAIPIVLVELAYSERRNESWVGKKSFAGLLVLLGAVTVFGYSLLTIYRPPPMQYFLSVVMVLVLVFIAWRIPSNAGGNGKRQVLSTVKLVLIGFLIALTFFLFFGAGPYIVSEPLILLVLGVGLVFLVFRFLKRYGWNEKTLRHKFSLAAGAVGFLIALTPLQELDMSRPDSTQGMLVVGIVALLMLVLLNRKLRSI
jgi:hypothetical protein